jgi:hypothetical protein
MHQSKLFFRRQLTPTNSKVTLATWLEEISSSTMTTRASLSANLQVPKEDLIQLRKIKAMTKI